VSQNVPNLKKILALLLSTPLLLGLFLDVRLGVETIIVSKDTALLDVTIVWS
jgi:hypothetical protein